jgi:Uma2 family endonuclease
MAIETRISNEQYEQMALAEPERKWELWHGRLREKPGMTVEHNWLGEKLGYLLMSQLDWTVYQVRTDTGRVGRPGGTYVIPDVFVLPTALTTLLRDRPGALEVYDQPLPLVVEIWSLSTGDYDLNEKLRIYQQRGDLEIWLIHPYERTLTAWRRQPDSSYEETVYRESIVYPAALPDVSIDLTEVFDA